MERLWMLLGMAISLAFYACDSDEGTETAQAAAPEQNKVQELMTDTTQRNNQEYLAELNDRIVESPDDAELYHERAYYYFHTGNAPAAIRDVKKSIELEPNSATYYFSKGFFFHSTLQLKEAETAFLQSIERDPNYKDAHFFLAKIYLAIARPDDKDKINYNRARTEIDEVLKIDQFHAESYFLRGVIYEELGDSGAALSAFKTATEQNADYYDAFIRMGLLYHRAGNPKGITAYESALSIKPTSTEAHFNLAKLYQDMRMLDEAESHYLQVVEIDSMYSLAYLNLGYLYMTEDTLYDKAIEYLHRAVYYNPGVFLPMTYYNIGLAFEYKKNYEQARRYYSEALKSDNEFDDAALALDDLDRRGL